ncbi:hypothetical protein KJS94_11190 [Flavihumibacter rivuli]|uniref:hypothetical protein n=1 Tax=Flavihumibacter rivuli TaxID=2838156 RepID=UPI001BDE38A0|nr:hypothetical protein [Flavihumibacter rivuli]ULQ55206.1 hypothetical protein KJS94_11190 [Flavihumibacter rivuli]
MRLSLIALLFLFYSTSFGQIKQYQNLLDTALNGHGCLFVHSKPIKINSLELKEMWWYFENIKERSNQILDTVMFSQIIHNSKFADITLWTDKELPDVLLVNERSESVSKKYALKKLELADNKQIKYYAKLINKFNSTETNDRDLYYFSRPVFDNSKTFAIIQWDNGHSYLGGGGGIILYQLQSDNTWKEFGIINSWRY